MTWTFKICGECMERIETSSDNRAEIKHQKGADSINNAFEIRSIKIIVKKGSMVHKSRRKNLSIKIT